VIFDSVPKELVVYKTNSGKEPFNDWVNKLTLVYKSRIKRLVVRLQHNNFNDYKFLRCGIYELRCHFGSGYRVYFGKEAEKIIILLCGGDKSTQTKDIEKAIKYWQDYKETKHD